MSRRHHRDCDPFELGAAVAQFCELIEEAFMTVNTDALVAAAQRAKKDNADMLAALTAVRDQNVAAAQALADVKAQLAAANGGDTSAAQAAIDQVTADLTKVATDTETAVNNNQAVPDMPPAAASAA